MFLYQLIFLFLAIKTLNADVPCQTPSGHNGDCVPITECQPLLAAFQNDSRKHAANLRSHHCGFIAAVPKVCCLVSARSPLLDNVGCGRSTASKIHGGEKAGLDEFPWMALLQYERSNGTKYFDCAGALINNRYVLTAAHCVKSPLKKVRLGEYDLGSEQDCIQVAYGDDCSSPPVDISIEEKIIHEGYKSDDLNQLHDIALLRLEQSVTYSDYIKPICLPNEAESIKSYIGSSLSIAGWGLTENNTRSNVKLKAVVPVKNNSNCETIYRRFNYSLKLGSGHLCVGGENGRDSCRGDSGGPLMNMALDEKREWRWYVTGLVSFGPTPCGMQNWPGVYTKISQYGAWIVSKLKP